MTDHSVKIGNAVFDNPVFGASGCTGHGYELKAYTDLSMFGAVSLKTVTPNARPGNAPGRIAEVSAGILSSIGLQNPGYEHFSQKVLPKALDCLKQKQIIISIGGDELADYVALAGRISAEYGERIAALEINAACPNVSHGAGFFSRDGEAAFELVSQIKQVTALPIIFKLNTNFESYCLTAQMVEKAGADAIYTTNTPLGMAIDTANGKLLLGNKKGPISGPAIRPIGILRTWELYQVVGIPIIASGGVADIEHALEYIFAGAAAVGVGCAQFVYPDAAAVIWEKLETYLMENHLSYHDLIGISHRGGF